LHEDLKDKMQALVGIIRSEEDLKQGLATWSGSARPRHG
jgi:succinate dehydrogenase/fumarate reductase flavoprotein subunit